MQALATQRAGGRLPTVPGIHYLQMATRYLPGGRPAFLELVQAAVLDGDVAARAWLTVFIGLSTYEQGKVSLDDVCAASGVGPAAILRAIVTTSVEHGDDLGNLVAALNHPKVVHQAAKSAMRIAGRYADIGLKDRTALLQHGGFLPTPKGHTTAVTVNASAGSSATAAAAASANPSVPSFKDDMRSLQTAKDTVQRELAGVPMPEREPIDAEVEDDEDEE